MNAASPYLLEAAGAGRGQSVCDVGCGGGSLTISVARAIAPEGTVVGLDISQGLLDLARIRVSEAGVDNARFVEVDVQTGTEERGPFDLVVSQFGVMFFDEPTKALAAIRGRLAATGRFVFACWQGVEKNPWHVATALRPLLPSPPTPPPGKSPTGPFAFGDAEYVGELLEAAGFRDVSSTAHEITVHGSASAVSDPALLPVMGVPAERADEAMALVAAHLARFSRGPDEYEYPLAFRVFQASA